MTTTLPTRQQVDTAGDLDFDAQRSASQAHISIELAPDGLHIRAEYIGTLGSIPAAVKRMVDAGLVDLVAAHRAAPLASASPAAAAPQAHKAPAAPAQPFYRPDGTACCPTHNKPLLEGQWGRYCPAKAAAGEPATPKGYCALKFAD